MSPSKSRRIESMLKQTAVYWGGPVERGAAGKTFADAIDVPVRWESKHETFTDANGDEQQSSSVVYCATTLTIGGYLYLGTLDDLSSGDEVDPMNLDGAWEIRGRFDTPDARAKKTVRKHWL